MSLLKNFHYKLLLKKIIYFLGSVYFAVGLIATSLFIVVLGTVVESVTDSHLFAAKLAYHNPVFLFLLILFFVNILISALRRWPFQKKHLPFLLTHLGLLMIIAGVIVKNTRGIQAQMTLTEGGATNTIFFSDSPRIYIDKRSGHQKEYELSKKIEDVEILHYTPHCKEVFETWIKGNFGFISGVIPFPVFSWKEEIVLSAKVKIPNDTVDYWEIYAYKAQNPQEVAKAIYLKDLKVLFTNRLLNTNAIENPLDPSNLNFDEQRVEFQFPDEKLTIFLSGEIALLNIQEKTTYFGHYPIAVDLIQRPKIVLIQDDDYQTHFYGFDKFGQVFHQIFSNERLENYLCYDGGFGGYSVAVKMPFSIQSFGRKEREFALFEPIKELLQNANTLSAPLQLFKEACQTEDFPSLFCLYLSNWHSLLCPNNLPDSLQAILSRLDWSSLCERDRKGAIFGSFLLKDLEESLMRGESFGSVLLQKKWPLASLMPSVGDGANLLTNMLQQVALVCNELPDNIDTDSNEMFATLLRIYGIHPNAFEKVVSFDDQMVFECPLTFRHEPKDPQKKLEENRPMVLIKAGNETVTLAYDPYGLGLKWPILNGEALVSFRSKIEKIPYKVRLRDARQLNYPGTNQAFSYESDLLITDLKKQTSVAKTISMNRIYQTWNGTRFYLSNISPSDETSVQRIQLVVNCDPAKYWLTYPGVFIVVLGVILLFSKKNLLV